MSQNLTLNQYVMESGSMNILAGFYLSVYHIIWDPTIIAGSEQFPQKKLKAWTYVVLMKSPTFFWLGVQILLLGEKYQQEFGNGKRRLLYDQKENC